AAYAKRRARRREEAWRAMACLMPQKACVARAPWPSFGEAVGAHRAGLSHSAKRDRQLTANAWVARSRWAIARTRSRASREPVAAFRLGRPPAKRPVRPRTSGRREES